MAKGLLLVFTKPVSDDREDAFNRWYDNHHVPDVVGIEGFTSGTRYHISEQQNRAGVETSTIADLPYLAAYEIDADDPTTAIQNLLAGQRDEQGRRLDFVYEDETLDRDTVFSVFFEQITEPVTSG